LGSEFEDKEMLKLIVWIIKIIVKNEEKYKESLRELTSDVMIL